MLSSLSNIRNQLVLLAFLLVTTAMSAQEIKVEDPVLADLLCTEFPNAMSADCQRLDTIKASTLYPSPLTITFENAGLTSADELLYFTEADTIMINQNQLTSFPVDISAFRSLIWLNIANNQLTIAPDLKYNNPISGDTMIKQMYLNDNLIDSLPSSWYLPNGLTQVVDLKNNLLDTIPDFGNTFNEMRRLDLRGNYLQFEELIPIKDNARWATSQFDLFPQKEFPVYEDMEVVPGETVELTFGTGHAGDTYILMKNDSEYRFSNDGVFILNNITPADTANYWVKIRNNAEFPAVTDYLRTTEFKITFPYDKIQTTTNDDIQIFSPDGDGIDDVLFIDGEGEAVFYNKNGEKILMENLPYTWYGLDKKGAQVTPGLYLIQLGDGNYLKVLVSY